MFLERLEVQGFKTFAKRTRLDFLAPKGTQHHTTAVVGPNGSGKSNLADAIRWALGEQSLKLLRGKKSEDVIFSGSEGQNRAGLAEVILTFNNEDGSVPIEFPHIVLTRRLYRNGESEYLLNEYKARLSDIQLLLAQANVGQRSYCVVGQGMVDHILVASPEERKEFFDDATGVKPFQIKRHEAMLKLRRTQENLIELERVLGEITPRLSSLKRQVSRLAKREETEIQLRDLERRYYGSLWWGASRERDGYRQREQAITAQLEKEKTTRKELEGRFAELATVSKEESQEDTTGLAALQTRYQEAQKHEHALRERQFDIRKHIELEKVRAQSSWTPLPLLDIVKHVKSVVDLLKNKDIDGAFSLSSKLLKQLERPDSSEFKTDPALLEQVERLEIQVQEAKKRIEGLEREIQQYAKKEKQVRTDLLEIQQALSQKQKDIHAQEKDRNEISIALARLDERLVALKREMLEHMKEAAQEVMEGAQGAHVAEGEGKKEELYPEIQRLRYKLELIGGIDPEIVAEHKQIEERHTFLETQLNDLTRAMRDTEKVIDELDEQIRLQSEKAFRNINKEFQRFFKMLFGGGSCSLVPLSKAEVDEEAQEPAKEGAPAMPQELEASKQATRSLKEREDRVVGIDIQATPPGKKLKALNLLSGGERAMASIALISAIMAVNPSPFVVLDEVDAALDEANTRRFAAILEELSKLTQFIVITHNRATMEKSDILYGVTMGENGVSNLLSVKLEEVEQGDSARR